MMRFLDRIVNQTKSSLPNHPQLGQGSIIITNFVYEPIALSIIPDECELSIDRGYTPGESLSDILLLCEYIFTWIKGYDAQFNATIKVRSLIEISYSDYQMEVQKHNPVWILAKDHPFVTSTMKALY